MSSVATRASFLPPEIYEAEFEYWPWGELIGWVIAWVADHAPRGGYVLDHMCGPGFAAGKIKERRPDLTVVACDELDSYVAYGTENYPGVKFVRADARAYVPQFKSNVIICTGSLHHLPFEGQAGFVKKMLSELEPTGVLIIGEAAIPEYRDRRTRALAALELGRELVAHGIESEWPKEMIGAAANVLRGDLMLDEYKRSASEWKSLLESHCEVRQVERFWAPKCGGGDIAFICEHRNGAARGL